jgi:hypothetical protein
MADWRDKLSGFFEESDNAHQEEAGGELERFIATVVSPAFQEVAHELEKHWRHVTIRSSETAATLIVSNNGEEEMMYRVQGRMFPNGILPFAEVRFRERKGRRYITVESVFRSGASDYTLADVTPGEVIENFLEEYMRRVKQA